MDLDARVFVRLFSLLVFLTLCHPVHATEVGGNGMDLMMAYRGQSASMGGSPAEVWTGTAMGRRMIADARDMGFKFMRVAVGGFGPSNSSEIGWNLRDDLTPWLTNPDAYWATTDQMFADLDAAGLKIVPVLMWNPPQFPALSHETVSMMINGPSTSRLMAKSFIQSFLKRYGSRSTILFIELTNEWNLLADLDSQSWCLQNGGSAVQCAPLDNFTTAALASFITEMANFVHYTAPGILVSSGFSLPRPAAWHLSQSPAWSPTGADWTLDTPAQLAANIAQLHQGLDIVSVHVYPGDVRFGAAVGSEGQTVVDVTQIAHKLGKRLYVGEFGDTSQSAYLASMFQGFASAQVDYASVWAVEFYQVSTIQFASGLDLDPQYTQPLDAYISSQIGAAAPNPSEPARVVLASPLPCSTETVGQPFTVYAQASSPTSVSAVTFYLDGTQAAVASAAPYNVQVTVQHPEVAVIQAAVSNGGTVTTTTIPVAVGVAASACSVPSAGNTSVAFDAAPAAPTVTQAVAQVATATAAPIAADNGPATLDNAAANAAQAAEASASAQPASMPATEAEASDARSDAGADTAPQTGASSDLRSTSSAGAERKSGRMEITMVAGPGCIRPIGHGPLYADRWLRSRRCQEGSAW